jgi:hypothetical protein
MRNLKWHLTVRCASALVLLMTALTARTRAADPCPVSVLPKEIQTKLEKNYTDWQPEKLEHLYENDRELWSKAHPTDCPGIAVGHFELKTALSYAVLLISKPDRKRLGFRLIVFSRSGPSAPYVSHLVTKWNIGLLYQGSDEVIATVPPGHYEEAIGRKDVHTDLDAILSETLEKDAAVYYWRNGCYHELVTSE